MRMLRVRIPALDYYSDSDTLRKVWRLMIVRIIFLVFCAMGMLTAQAQAQLFLEQRRCL